MRLYQNVALGLVGALLVLACGGGEASRPQVLSSLATNEIVPSFEQLADDTAELEAAVSQLCDSPTVETFAASREALAAARLSWSASEAMWVGPVMERRLWALIDWPIDTEEVDALIADSSIVLDDERLSSRIGADQRGLSAIDYVLGDPTEDDSTFASLKDERRCDYLTGIAAVASDAAAVVLADWTTDFEDGGPWSETFADLDTMGLDTVVNDALFLVEDVTDRELGAAIGVMGEADPEAVVEGPSGLAAADIAGHVVGLRAVLVGSSDDDTESGSDGLAPLLGEDLAKRLTEAFDAADLAIAEVEGPLAVAIVDSPDLVAEAREAIKEIQNMVATEVVSRLGVTIGFSDADGDTGS